MLLEELKGKLTLTSSLKTIVIEIAIDNPPSEKLKLKLPLIIIFRKIDFEIDIDEQVRKTNCH